MAGDAPIPLARPVLGHEEEAGVLEVLRSGRLSLGPRVPEFETAFADWLGAAHASAVSSGTAAVTRVLLDSSDGVETWGTIGVSENIIEASWEALVDSLEAGMTRSAEVASP